MLAARLHGPHDLRIDEIPHPGPPGPGQALLRVGAVGVCGSDLHTFLDARIGNTAVTSPLILGHEFAGIIEAGPHALDGTHRPLPVGTSVAVDPAWPCGQCELCRRGDPNLCLHLHFAGLAPDGGALCQWMLVPASACFPLPATIDFAQGALLETLGVALHAVDLAKIRPADSVAILGAGPIGLCILQAARLAGAGPIFISDKFPWRLALVEKLGGIPIPCDTSDPVASVRHATAGRGVDVAIEAAWADATIQQAAAMARSGGRLVLVGIPGDERLTLQHSTARRKGLTIRMARRMKFTYPRAIELVRRGSVDLNCLITHRAPLERAAEAIEMNARYGDGVIKTVVDI